MRVRVEKMSVLGWNKSIETSEVLVCSVLAFGMDHINKLKVKGLRVLLCYHVGLEKLKGIPKKMELVEAVMDFLERTGRVSCRYGSVGGVGWGVCCNKRRC